MVDSYNKLGFILPLNDLNLLTDVLKEYGEIIAPVQDNGWTRMQSLQKTQNGDVDLSKITFKGISWYTSKKEVFPDKQTIFAFENTKIIKPKKEEIKNKVLFGLRMCDTNSFMINDKLFLEQEPVNENYKNNREKITLVGLWCNNQVDNYCFCSSMDLKHYYDVCLFEIKDENTSEIKYYHIKANSQRGEEILFKLNQKLLLNNEDYEPQTPECRNKLKGTDVGRFFDRNDAWEKGSEKCLSCGDCTTLCPTCLCFDVKDEVNIDLTSGVRVANWDSCMYKDFTKAAGNNYARESRVERFKHRIFHKLVYFPKKFDGQTMCTGCGRCIRGCPTKIHWVCEVNGLLNEEEKNCDGNQNGGENNGICR